MRNAPTHANGQDLAKEIATLKMQLDKLAETVDSASGSLLARGEEAIEDALQAAQDFIDKHSDAAKDAASRIGKESIKLRDRATDSLIETAEARPLATLAIVLGAGFLAGYLFRRE